MKSGKTTIFVAIIAVIFVLSGCGGLGEKPVQYQRKFEKGKSYSLSENLKSEITSIIDGNEEVEDAYNEVRSTVLKKMYDRINGIEINKTSKEALLTRVLEAGEIKQLMNEIESL